MRALVFDGQLQFTRDYPMPRVPADESLVRVVRAGICNTDLEICKGYLDFRGVLGHEFVGVVQEGAMQGARVVGEINASDGTCPTCLRGDATHCPQRTTLGIVQRDGAFAEYLTLPTRNLHRVPDAVSDAQAVFVEPLAAALEITERVHIRPTDRVAVIGDGKLGLLCAQVLQLTGCDVLVIGRHEKKLAILNQRGIRTTTDAPAIKEQFDIVVDCTGNAGGFELARRLTRPRGILILKSTFHGAQAMEFAPMVVDEISIVGSRCGPFAPALRLLERKLVDVESMLSAEYPLARGLEAFERAGAVGVLKVQIVIGDG
ncbi:MAG: alcohol dehydrogenase catalytic domain-containing protein [Chloroflexi bacterium]|nr:alcohol dehydrogenase catalytic domain-containing protein [Chloroflexota bacterium]